MFTKWDSFQKMLQVKQDILLIVGMFALHMRSQLWILLFAHSQATLHLLEVPLMQLWAQKTSGQALLVNIIVDRFDIF